MIGDPRAKVGLVGVLLIGVWGVGVGIDRLGGGRLVREGAREGALTPEVAQEIHVLPPDAPVKHTALVTLSVPKVSAIDPGTIQVTTDGLSLENAQVRPIVEFRPEANPKPRSILLLMDNSRSMVMNSYQGPASDPEYRRLDAGRSLLQSLTKADQASLASFPCRRSVDDQVNVHRTARPFELLTPPVAPDVASGFVEVLRDEENGSTPLYRAVQAGAESLAKAPPERKRILVLLTDGRDTDDDPDGLQKAAAAVKAAGVEMYAVGLGGGADMGVLETMVGAPDHALRSDDATALSRAFRQILLQMSRRVVQMDLDVMVARNGRPIPPGQKVVVTFRSGGKLYTTQGKTQ